MAVSAGDIIVGSATIIMGLGLMLVVLCPFLTAIMFVYDLCTGGKSGQSDLMDSEDWVSQEQHEEDETPECWNAISDLCKIGPGVIERILYSCPDCGSNKAEMGSKCPKCGGAG